MMNLKNAALALALGLALTGTAMAARVDISSDITTSTTWTADNTYNLTTQVYVKDGATLTIEAGTVIASTPQANGGGSLAVTRGSKIEVKGTKDAPVVMTSTADPQFDGDPNTNGWAPGALEWGNLTIMGNALISASHYDGDPVLRADGVTPNTKTPDAGNEKQMEGLVAAYAGDPNVMYGGGDDDDDSGSISYLSLRRGGRVVGLANELNGLSLGGIGRETEISHVEIMNNVDDGIEIWGGTVEIKYFSIWNIGDDSFDVDQGWRGKAQFGLIVQGYSLEAKQGSGVGDNCFETDGAEDSDAQPVTTATIYNCTVIGQPSIPSVGGGDGATTWRDGARVQYRNCIFMDIGGELVRPDGDDGDGANGYGYNGTYTFPEVWTVDATNFTDPKRQVNIGTASMTELYQAQVDGKLAEITDSVFYNVADYTDADEQGVRDPGNNNVTATNMPVQALTRASLDDAVYVTTDKGTTITRPVTWLNPCAANDAVSSVGTAPADGFFTPAPFRGAFSATYNWLEGWTATDAYGMVDTSMNQAHATPTATPALTKVVTTTTFDTEAGVAYTVEKSSDLKAWIPVETVIGTGAEMSVEDLETFEDGKFYRVVKQ